MGDRRAVSVTALWLLVVGAVMGTQFGTGIHETVSIGLATAVLMSVVIASAFGVVRWMVESEVLAPD